MVEASSAQFTPTLWRCLDVKHPECGLAFDRIKRRFWRGPEQTRDALWRRWLDVTPDALSNAIFARAAAQTVAKPIRAGDKDKDVKSEILAHLDHRTPQYNLRNVARLTREQDDIQWGKQPLPDRRGYHEDLAEVRAAKIDPPEFHEEVYAGAALTQFREMQLAVYIMNDWEQWYGEDKKRVYGSMWKYVPDGGGKRTRPWPEIRLKEHKYWKGRLMEA